MATAGVETAIRHQTIQVIPTTKSQSDVERLLTIHTNLVTLGQDAQDRFCSLANHVFGASHLGDRIATLKNDPITYPDLQAFFNHEPQLTELDMFKLNNYLLHNMEELVKLSIEGKSDVHFEFDPKKILDRITLKATIDSAHNVSNLTVPLNARYAVALGDDYTSIYVWDLETNALHHKFESPAPGDTFIDISLAWEDKGILVAAQRDKIFGYEIKSKTLSFEMDKTHGKVAALALSQDGWFLVSAGTDKIIKLWDASEQSNLGTFEHNHTDSITGLAFTDDESLVISTSRDRSIRFLDIATRKEVYAFEEAHSAPIVKMCLSAHSRFLCTISEDLAVKVWNVETRQHAYDVGHPISHWDIPIAFSPNGALLFLGEEPSNDITVFDMRNKAYLTTFSSSDSQHKGTNSIACSPNGDLLITSGHDKKLRVWSGNFSFKYTEIHQVEHQATTTTIDNPFPAASHVTEVPATAKWQQELQETLEHSTHVERPEEINHRLEKEQEVRHEHPQPTEPTLWSEGKPIVTHKNETGQLPLWSENATIAKSGHHEDNSEVRSTDIHHKPLTEVLKDAKKEVNPLKETVKEAAWPTPTEQAGPVEVKTTTVVTTPTPSTTVATEPVVTKTTTVETRVETHHKKEPTPEGPNYLLWAIGAVGAAGLAYFVYTKTSKKRL